MFKITYSDGTTQDTMTRQDARELIAEAYPDCVWDQDSELYWANEDDAENDDGRKAIARVSAVEPDAD